ncbi:MAG: thioredoxin family protein [Candidatus Krumholzibacteriia bacterium]
MTNDTHSAPSATARTGSHPFWRVFWLAFLVASLAYAWYSFYVPANDVAWAQDFDEARTLAAESDRPLLLFFTAEWCVPCRVMKREVFADREVMQAIDASVVPLMLYAGEPGADAVFARYQVGGTPVTIFTDPAGTVLDYEVGRIGKARFLEMLGDLGASPAAATR